MRTVIFFYACFSVAFIAQAAADDLVAALIGKQEQYPGNSDLCKQMVERICAGVDVAVIKDEQLAELNHPQLNSLAWHVGVYKKACDAIAMRHHRPELWNRIERIRTELKTAKPKEVRNAKEYRTPEQETYDYIFERKAQLSAMVTLINQELTLLGFPAEPEPWQLLDVELFAAYQEKKNAAHVMDRPGDGALSKALEQQINNGAGEAIKREQLKQLNCMQLQELQKRIGACCEAYNFMQKHCCRQRKFWQHVDRMQLAMAPLKEQPMYHGISKEPEYRANISAAHYLKREQESAQVLDARIKRQLSTWNVQIDTDSQGLLDVRITKKESKSL